MVPTEFNDFDTIRSEAVCRLSIAPVFHNSLPENSLSVKDILVLIRAAFCPAGMWGQRIKKYFKVLEK
jgi:hypothetical protein